LEELPDEIGNLVNLEVLEIHGSMIRILPSSIRYLPKLRYLGLAGNWFDFSQLEQLFVAPGQPFIPHISGITNDYYDDQRTLYGNYSNIQECSSLTLDSEIGGQYTHWQWMKLVEGDYWNGVWDTIPGATHQQFTLESIRLDDAGHYKCVATNDWVTTMIQNSYFEIQVVENEDCIDEG